MIAWTMGAGRPQNSTTSRRPLCGHNSGTVHHGDDPHFPRSGRRGCRPRHHGGARAPGRGQRAQRLDHAEVHRGNPEDGYADDEYADHDAEDREQPSVTAEIPDDEPEDDVLDQRQEVPYGDDGR
jgi:hypothetical protein